MSLLIHRTFLAPVSPFYRTQNKAKLPNAPARAQSPRAPPLGGFKSGKKTLSWKARCTFRNSPTKPQAQAHPWLTQGVFWGVKYDRRPRSCGHALSSRSHSPPWHLPQEGDMEGLVFEERPRDFALQTRGRSHGFNRARQPFGERARYVLTVDRESATSELRPESTEGPTRAARRFKGRFRHEGWSGESDTLRNEWITHVQLACVF